MDQCNTHVRTYAKRIVIGLLLSAMLFSVTACKKLPPAQSGVLDEDQELNIGGEVTLTISNESNSPSEQAAPDALARAFMQKYPGVKVKVESADRNSFATRISSGEIGDVFWCDALDAHNYKRNHNALMMLDYYVDKLGIDISNVFSGALDPGRIDGRLYMVPRNFGQQILIYNKDALKQANIEIPSGGEAIAWEEFKSICRQLTLEENGAYTQVGANFNLWWAPVWQAFAEGWGGKWVDTINKKVSFTSDQNVMKGLNEMFSACEEGWLKSNQAYTGAKADLYKNLSDVDYVFRTFGDMQWITSYGKAYNLKNIDWDFCSFPEFPTHKVGAGATGYVVFNRSSNTDTAAALALFFLTEEGQRAYHSTTGGNVPLLKSLANDDFWRMSGTEYEGKNFDAFVSYPECNIPASVIVRAPSEISAILSTEALTKAFGDIIEGKVSIEDTFSKLETTCNEKWSTLNDF